MTISSSFATLAWVSTLTLSCGGPPAAETPPPAPTPSVVPSVAAVTVETSPLPPKSGASAAPAPGEAPTVPTPKPVLTYTGFATPESALYDAAGDRYLVSNVNGKPGDADGNGFISELSPDGQVKNAKLIAGGVGKVKLDAPKGSAIVGTTLYVADITVVRKFDLKTGAPKGDVAFPAGVTFLNDVAAAPDGRVFVSDSSIVISEKGITSNGADQVFVIEKSGKVKSIAKTPELGGPNGLFFTPKGLLVNTFGTNEVYRLTDAGKREDILKLPGGTLDGLLVVGDWLLASSWQTNALYRAKLGTSDFSPLVKDVKGAADFGFDSKRSRILLPRFLEDRVEVFELK